MWSIIVQDQKPSELGEVLNGVAANEKYAELSDDVRGRISDAVGTAVGLVAAQWTDEMRVSVELNPANANDLAGPVRVIVRAETLA